MPPQKKSHLPAEQSALRRRGSVAPVRHQVRSAVQLVGVP